MNDSVRRLAPCSLFPRRRQSAIAAGGLVCRGHADPEGETVPTAQPLTHRLAELAMKGDLAAYPVIRHIKRADQAVSTIADELRMAESWMPASRRWHMLIMAMPLITNWRRWCRRNALQSLHVSRISGTICAVAVKTGGLCRRGAACQSLLRLGHDLLRGSKRNGSVPMHSVTAAG